KGIDYLSLAVQLDAFYFLRSSDSSPSATRKLPGGCRRFSDDGRNLIEGDIENVMHPESQSLCRRQSVQHCQQSEANGISEDRFLPRVRSWRTFSHSLCQL